jgi:hypothetical protein
VRREKKEKEEGCRADVRERVRISERGSMAVHGRAVIPLLAKNELVAGLGVRQREYVEAEAGVALAGVRGAEREAQLRTEPVARADEQRHSILHVSEAVREIVEDKRT